MNADKYMHGVKRMKAYWMSRCGYWKLGLGYGSSCYIKSCFSVAEERLFKKYIEA